MHGRRDYTSNGNKRGREASRFLHTSTFTRVPHRVFTPRQPIFIITTSTFHRRQMARLPRDLDAMDMDAESFYDTLLASISKGPSRKSSENHLPPTPPPPPRSAPSSTEVPEIKSLSLVNVTPPTAQTVHSDDLNQTARTASPLKITAHSTKWKTPPTKKLQMGTGTPKGPRQKPMVQAWSSSLPV